MAIAILARLELRCLKRLQSNLLNIFDNSLYLVLMKLVASRTTDISDISRMLGQANDGDLDRVRNTIKVYDRESLEDLESLIELGKLELGG